MDLIDRQDAIDAIDEWGLLDGLSEWLAKEILADEDKVPSAQQWIPCSERLPEDDSLMLVNYIDNRPDAMDVWIGWHEMENVWYINGEAHSKEYGNEVIAWMPLPEPYKGEEHETN